MIEYVVRDAFIQKAVPVNANELLSESQYTEITKLSKITEETVRKLLKSSRQFARQILVEMETKGFIIKKSKRYNELYPTKMYEEI